MGRGARRLDVRARAWLQLGAWDRRFHREDRRGDHDRCASTTINVHGGANPRGTADHVNQGMSSAWEDVPFGTRGIRCGKNWCSGFGFVIFTAGEPMQLARLARNDNKPHWRRRMQEARAAAWATLTPHRELAEADAERLARAEAGKIKREAKRKARVNLGAMVIAGDTLEELPQRRATR